MGACSQATVVTGTAPGRSRSPCSRSSTAGPGGRVHTADVQLGAERVHLAERDAHGRLRVVRHRLDEAIGRRGLDGVVDAAVVGSAVDDDRPASTRRPKSKGTTRAPSRAATSSVEASSHENTTSPAPSASAAWRAYSAMLRLPWHTISTALPGRRARCGATALVAVGDVVGRARRRSQDRGRREAGRAWRRRGARERDRRSSRRTRSPTGSPCRSRTGPGRPRSSPSDRRRTTHTPRSTAGRTARPGHPRRPWWMSSPTARRPRRSPRAPRRSRRTAAPARPTADRSGTRATATGAIRASRACP